jgi:hypothetical protein
MAKEQEGLGEVVIPSMKQTPVKRSTTYITTIIIFHDSKVIAIILDITEKRVHSFQMIQPPKSTPCRLNMKMVILKKRRKHLTTMNLRWL